MPTTLFGSDRPLLYDVEPWNRLGFAVPNWANQIGTVSMPIWRLANEIGTTQLLIMTHVDAAREAYPSMNTVRRIGKLLNRVRTVLNARQKRPEDLRLEEQHASAQLMPWNVHPVPYFESAVVKNPWLAEYNHLVMVALTNIYQHSDNNLALTVTSTFAGHLWPYFREIQLLLGMELLGLPEEQVAADDFTFDDTAYLGYQTIEDRVLSVERLATPGPIQSRATEQDLQHLFSGIPATQLVSVVRQYPVGEGDLGFSGAPLPEDASSPGTDDRESIGPAGGGIGDPQL